jgi:hypothetical protein
MSSTGFQERALQNRSAISIISPTSNERLPVRQRLLDGRVVSVPPHQVAVLSEQPNLVLVNPQTSIPSGAFAGAETFCDFELPDQLHIITGLTVAFNMNFTDNSGVCLAPTPYWCSRIEVYAGKDIIETLYNEAVYNDAIAWRDIQNRREWADPLNFTADLDTALPLALQLPYENTSTLVNAVGTPSPLKWSSADNGTIFYLPLSCCLTQGKVFASGFVVPFRIRLYFAPRIVDTSQGGTAQPTLNQVQVWVSEQQLSSVNFEAKLREHRNGNVLYKFVMKDRYMIAFNATANNAFITQLKAFKSLCAGLVFTITDQDQNTNPNKAQLRSPTVAGAGTGGSGWSVSQSSSEGTITQAQLLDAVGRRMTEVLPDRVLRRFIFPKHISSDYSVYKQQYIFPFSSDFGETVRNGVNLGYAQLTTLEQLSVTPIAGGSCMLTIYAYNYATLSCNGGVPQITYT